MPSKVLITRESAEPLWGLLEVAGFEPVHVPLSILKRTGALPPSSVPDVVVVTSAAVARFVPGLASHIGRAQVAAVGGVTASALQAIDVQVQHQGDTGGAALVEDLLSPDLHLWYVGASQPSAGLEAALEARTGRVDRWLVYENHLPESAGDELCAAGATDLVSLTSASAARRYAALAGDTAAPAVVIGQSTAAAAHAAGLQVVAQAASPTLHGLVQAALRI